MSRFAQVFLVLSLIGSQALAQPAERRVEARERFDRGLRLFDQGDDEGALAEFQRAYSLVPNTRVLYNIGLVRASLHQPVEAVTALDELLRAPGSIPGELVEHARRVREEQKARIAFLSIGLGDEPRSASVEIDGSDAGTAPFSKAIPIASGTHRVTVTASGYVPARKELTLASGENKAVTFTLEKLESGALAELEVKTPIPGATLAIDGRVLATTPLSSPLVLAPGQHEVELRRDGYRSVKRKVLLQAGGTKSLSIPLEVDAVYAKNGRLELAIREENAVIFVDGVPSSAHALELPHGSHRVRVERSGFFPFERGVSIPPGGAARVRIELEPKPDFRASYRESAKSRRFWSLVAMGGGAAVLGGGVGFLVWNKAKRDDAQEAFDREAPRYEKNRECNKANPMPATDCRDLETLADDIDSANARFGIGWALVAVGAAGVGAGTFFLLTGDDPDRYEPRPESDVFGRLRLIPSVGPRSASFVAHGRF